MPYCSADEVRTELQEDSTVHPDTNVDAWIAAAQACIDRELNNTYESKKATTEKHTLESSETASAVGGVSPYTFYFLRKRPESVADITEVKLNGDVITPTMELLEAGKLRVEKVVGEADIMEFTYNYGLTSVPEDIKRLCIQVSANFARNRDQPTVSSIKTGEFSSSFKELNPHIMEEIHKIKRNNAVSDARII